MKMCRFLNKMRFTSKLFKLFFYIFVVSLFLIALEGFVYVFFDHFGRNSLPRRSLGSSEQRLAVLVLSNREAFDRREEIRKTWASGHNNVFFIVGERYCPYPPENRVLDTCSPKNISIKREDVESYLDKENMLTRKLMDEPNVILVPTGDSFSELQKKVVESFIWALKTLRAKWFLHVEDTVEVEVDKCEQFLHKDFNQFNNIAILSSLKQESRILKNGQKLVFLGQFLCGLNHVVSRCVAEYAVNGFRGLFEYIYKHSNPGIRIADTLNITLSKSNKLEYMTRSCNMTSFVQVDIYFKLDQINASTCLEHNALKIPTLKPGGDTTYILFENPSAYLDSDRFDLIVKMVYAHFYVSKSPTIPTIIIDAYKDHLKVWNNFKEYCGNLNKVWFDAKRPCVEKRSSSDFVSAFHTTIDHIKTFGFNSSISRIPVDKEGFLLNGAHRLAASVILSKYAFFEHHNYKTHFQWGYKHFKGLKLSESTFNLVILEWMKIQMHLPSLNTLVSIVSVFSNSPEKDKAMRKIVQEKCSKDNGIFYEITVNFTKKGARQLITHMYGKQSWLEIKIQQMLSKFKFSTYSVLFLFVYGKDINDLTTCKEEIRKLYKDKVFKSTVHIPDTAKENLILAEMILNKNSLQFMNYAGNAAECKLVAKEIASRSSIEPIKTLPGIYLGREDTMIDSGAVLGLFGLRNRTDVDILFLKDVDKSILGDRHGLTIQAHAFKFNSISNERAWGEDHFSENGPKDQWDLFYDPQNYGYCYGIKFVSLQQMIRYKTRRNEPKKDQYDVRLINELLKSFATDSNS